MGGCQNWHPGAGRLLALGSPGAHLQSDYLGLALLGKAVVGGLQCCRGMAPELVAFFQGRR